MAAHEITEETLELWRHGFNPIQHGWKTVGPAAERRAVRDAMAYRREGWDVETFISPFGRLTYYRRQAREAAGRNGGGVGGR